MSSRISALKAALLLFSLPALGYAENPKNVVVLDICSARADHFGVYGYPKPTTPGIDALAKDSLVFDQAIAQSSWCLPNYASLFTGHTPEVHGQYTNLPFRKLADFETTLASRLGEAGYRTAAFSGGIYLMPAWGLQRGFDEYVNLFSTATAMPRSFAELSPKIVDWVKANKKSPFFVYAAVDDLHAPYQSEDPERFDPGYEGIVHDTATLNVRFFRAFNGETLPEKEELDRKLAIFRQDPKHLKHLSAHYDAALHSVDRLVARFTQRLKALGLWENTVLIVTADHGELLGEHGLLGHTEGLYEPVLRVPLLIRHPGFPQSAGRRVSEPVQRIDLVPTILDIAQAPHDGAELQGQSLLPLLRDPSAPHRPYAYASSKRNMASSTDLTIDERVIRDKRWKLIWRLDKDRYELYDLQNDPQELREVSREHPEIVHELSARLLRQVELSRPHSFSLPSGGKEPGDLRPIGHAD